MELTRYHFDRLDGNLFESPCVDVNILQIFLYERHQLRMDYVNQVSYVKSIIICCLENLIHIPYYSIRETFAPRRLFSRAG